MPVLFNTGHTHIRKKMNLDKAAVSFEVTSFGVRVRCVYVCWLVGLILHRQNGDFYCRQFRLGCGQGLGCVWRLGLAVGVQEKLDISLAFSYV